MIILTCVAEFLCLMLALEETNNEVDDNTDKVMDQYVIIRFCLCH